MDEMSGNVRKNSKASFKSAVYVIIKKEDKILLQRRQGTKAWCGFLALPAGHIDAGENPVQAMIREIKEELGMIVTEEQLINPTVVERNCTDNKLQYYDVYYELVDYNEEPKIMEPNKCLELIWADVNNLPKDMITFEKDALAQREKGVKFYYTVSNEKEQDLPNLSKD